MPRILSLMFHRIHDPLKRDRVLQFERFLKTLAKDYSIVLPNENKKATFILQSENKKASFVFPNKGMKTLSPAICLTFDDAYYDFYHYVYPLLKTLNIKAILAIPVHAITADTQASAQDRLSVITTHPTAAHLVTQVTPLCTWKEINEMAQSGHVIMASHGYHHADLTLKNTNIREEIETSKKVLEQQLKKTIQYFVYPYGRMNRRIHEYVRQHYDYGIRIGSAYNFSSHCKTGLIYRMDADPFWRENKKIDHPFVKLKLSLSYYGNRLRQK